MWEKAPGTLDMTLKEGEKVSVGGGYGAKEREESGRGFQSSPWGRISRTSDPLQKPYQAR